MADAIHAVCNGNDVDINFYESKVCHFLQGKQTHLQVTLKFVLLQTFLKRRQQYIDIQVNKIYVMFFYANSFEPPVLVTDPYILESGSDWTPRILGKILTLPWNLYINLLCTSVFR